MSDVQKLVSQQYMSTVMKYLLNKNKNSIALFVEGEEDISFYGNIIDNRLYNIAEKKFYICNGKPKLYQVYHHLEAIGDNSDLRLYFVDKDLSDFLDDDPTPTENRLYVTELYSIENYIADKNILHRLVRDIYRLKNLEYKEIEENYFNFRSKVDPILQDIMAWIFIQRRKGYRPTLKDKDLNNLIRFNNELKIILSDPSKEAWEIFSDWFPLALAVTQNEVEVEALKLKKMEYKTWLRGKYDLWAFVIYIDKFPAYYMTIDVEKKAIPKIPAQGNTIMGHLFPRCTPSPQLLKFLDDNLAMLVKI